MSNKIVYISGPITGVSDYEVKFAEAETKLRELGYDVINPALLDRLMPVTATWDDYMHICIPLLDLATHVMMLPGWGESRGCNAEFDYACKNKKTFINEDYELAAFWGAKEVKWE